MGHLDGKVAFITGASSGVGEATALRFAAEGARVSLIARREQEGERVVRGIQDQGGTAIFFRADVSNAEDVDRAVEKTVSEFGTLDIGVNNAGILGEMAPIMDMDTENWLNVLNINLHGVFHAMRAEARAMKERGG